MLLSQKCDSHKWCTNHDEKKYKEIFEKLKFQIESECPEVTVIENQEHPSIMSIISQPTVRTPFLKLSFPKTGSFEVYFRGKVIFSKLKLGIWPHPAMVAKSIRDILDGNHEEPKSAPQSTGFKEYQSKPEVPKRQKAPVPSQSKKDIPPKQPTSVTQEIHKTQPPVAVEPPKPAVEVTKSEPIKQPPPTEPSKAPADNPPVADALKAVSMKFPNTITEKHEEPKSENKVEPKPAEEKKETTKPTLTHPPAEAQKVEKKEDHPPQAKPEEKGGEPKHDEKGPEGKHVDEHKEEAKAPAIAPPVADTLKAVQAKSPTTFTDKKDEPHAHVEHPPNADAVKTEQIKPTITSGEKKEDSHPPVVNPPGADALKAVQIKSPDSSAGIKPDHHEEKKHEENKHDENKHDEKKHEEKKHEEKKHEESKHEEKPAEAKPEPPKPSVPEEHKAEAHPPAEKPHTEVHTEANSHHTKVEEKAPEHPPVEAHPEEHEEYEEEQYEEDEDQKADIAPPYKITDSYKVILSIGEGKNVKLPIKNESAADKHYTIQITNKSIFKIVETELTVGPGENKKLKMEIIAQSEPGLKKSYVVIATEEEVSACYEIVVEIN